MLPSRVGVSLPVKTAHWVGHFLEHIPQCVVRSPLAAEALDVGERALVLTGGAGHRSLLLSAMVT